MRKTKQIILYLSVFFKIHRKYEGLHKRKITEPNLGNHFTKMLKTLEVISLQTVFLHEGMHETTKNESIKHK